MTEPDGPRDEALKRFDERLSALSQDRQRKPRRFEEGGSGAGYTLIGELVGGVLTGLGLGWLVDRFAHTQPFGLIAGVLLGTGVAIYAVVRSANRMADAARTAVPPDETHAPALRDRKEG